MISPASKKSNFIEDSVLHNKLVATVNMFYFYVLLL